MVLFCLLDAFNMITHLMVGHTFIVIMLAGTELQFWISPMFVVLSHDGPNFSTAGREEMKLH
ncbi:MAG TPA: hypothetical protein VE593_02210 [Nitrososphaeraceae archaeon]|nr:hypothetical protein [Nitrososphaeraceae archaeon]